MFATYDELKSEIANWLHRGDLTEQIPTFIRMGEGWLNRKLRIRPMLVNVAVTLNANASTVALPSNAAWIQDVWVDGDKIDLGSDLSPLPEDIGTPAEWEPLSAIQFDCYADQAYAVTVQIGQRFDIASESINWLLQNAPEAYLYASLMRASQFGIDEPRLATSAGQAQAIVAELNKAYAIQNTDTLRVENGS